MMNVYLDNGSSTRMDEQVVSAMKPYFKEIYANPATIHKLGLNARKAVEESRNTIAESVNANAEELFFTSGGTESNNWALKSAAFNAEEGKKHLITTPVEHNCVLKSCRWLEKQGFEVTYLPVDKYGMVDADTLDDAIRDDTIIASIIHGNNEIGSINDAKTLGRICRDNNVLFHTDACQSYTKTPLDVKEQCIDLLTVNSHKIHGPNGIGALYINPEIGFKPWQHGGGQENGMRSGTVDVAGAVGFAKAVEVADESDVRQMTRLRDKLIKGLAVTPESWLNGHPTDRLCNNVHVSFRHIEGEGILMHLDERGIQVSTGSACSSESLKPSHVLTAIGLKPEESHGSIRYTLSRYTSEEDIDYTIRQTIEAVQMTQENLMLLG